MHRSPIKCSPHAKPQLWNNINRHNSKGKWGRPVDSILRHSRFAPSNCATCTMVSDQAYCT